MTWGEIKKQVQVLCNEPEKSDFEADYGFGLVSAANSCLKDLANTSAKFHDTLRISMPEVENILQTERDESFSHVSEPIQFSAELSVSGIYSYVFECDGEADVSIYDGDTSVVTINCRQSKSFVRYSGFFDATEGNVVKIEFSGEFLYKIRNIAIYPSRVSTNPDDIPDWASYYSFEMRRLVSEVSENKFKAFDDKLPVTLNGQPISDFAFDGDSVIMVSSDYHGEIGIPYTRYPTMLTEESPDDTEIDLDLASQDLMPYFIAARVYMDYDTQKSIIYKNEYEVRKQTTYNDLPVHSEWVSRYGWCYK